MSITILDLDNTIADDAWRIPYINWRETDLDRRYAKYHEASVLDCSKNRHLFAGKEDIVIFTARPEKYRAITESWLAIQGVKFSLLYMRKDGDHTHSAAMKMLQLEELFAEHGIGPKDIACAYDDRADVVDAYKKRGVNAKVISIHNISAYEERR